MEYENSLDAIQAMLQDGDTTGAVAGLLDMVAALMGEVDTLNVQMETLLDTLGSDEDDYFAGDECSYIVTCSQCGCVMEVDSELLEDEDAELSCPQCGVVLELQ